MKKQDINNLIDVNIPFDNDKIWFSYHEICQFVNNRSLKEGFDRHFNEFSSFIDKVTNNSLPFLFKTDLIGISIDPESYKCYFTFSSSDLYFYLVSNLLKDKEFNLEGYSTIELDSLSSQIKKLRHVRTPDELMERFPQIYEDIYAITLKFKNPELINIYENYKKDILNLNEVQIDKLENNYKMSKCACDFSYFISSVSNYFKLIVDNWDSITAWIKNNPFEIRVTHSDIKKINLYIIYCYITQFLFLISLDDKLGAQKDAIFIRKLIDKYKEKYPNDKESIKYNLVLNRGLINSMNESQTFNINQIEMFFNEIVAKTPFLNDKLEVPSIDKNKSFEENIERIDTYLSSLLNNTINDDINNGASVISDDEINNKIDQLEKEVKSNAISEVNRGLKELILKKIKMVLIDIKPKAKQTGIGLFKNYYIYFYPNGMVAVDKLDGYGALYIMPVHIYREARYKKYLNDVRNIPGVVYVTHKKKEWLEDARKYILEGTSHLTQKDIADSEMVASIDFPYTLEKLEKLQEELEKEGKFSKKVAEETKRRVEKIKKLESIDEDLKGEVNYDMPSDEYNEEEEEAVNDDKTFEELYDYWKRKHGNTKVKRNPVVAAETKNRARDEDGNYCCELCGAKSFIPADFESHHMFELGKGGIDNIYNTVCLCPNCHNAIHTKRVTLSQKAMLFKKIENHLIESNPEYLANYYEMISPIAKDEDDYTSRNDEIDSNFAIMWNQEENNIKLD